MKVKNFLMVSATTLLLMAGVAHASQFQAGDIAEGQKWPLTDTSGGASYFKMGKSGEVVFSCILEGEGVKAVLRGGKNLVANKPEYLQAGWNGPYVWTLRNGGSDNGTIRVELLKGDNVTVQCQEEF